MANPDDPDFDKFVNGIMNTTFSSCADLEAFCDDEKENILLHNLSESESEGEDIEPMQTEETPNSPTDVSSVSVVQKEGLAQIELDPNQPGPSQAVGVCPNQLGLGSSHVIVHKEVFAQVDLDPNQLGPNQAVGLCPNQLGLDSSQVIVQKEVLAQIELDPNQPGPIQSVEVCPNQLGLDSSQVIVQKEGLAQIEFDPNQPGPSQALGSCPNRLGSTQALGYQQNPNFNVGLTIQAPKPTQKKGLAKPMFKAKRCKKGPKHSTPTKTKQNRPMQRSPNLSPITLPVASRPVTASVSLPWTNVTLTDPGPPTTIPVYNVNHGPCLPISFSVESSPIDYFLLFFNDDLLEHICSESNLYGNKRKNVSTSPHARIKTWVNITLTDLKAFLGTVINMGIVGLPDIESYFSTKWESHIPFFSDVFSKNHFLNIFYNLHFNHLQQGQSNVPRGFLIEPVIKHVRYFSQLFYKPSSFVAVDESTISFKGHVSFRVYNPNKPTKFGLKVFVLSDCSNGYIYNFIPYFGKEALIPNSDLLKTTQIVSVLTESVVKRDAYDHTSGLHVYTDRFYTSLELGKELLKMNCYLTGTVMTNRTGLPIGLKAKQRAMKKGDIFSYRQGNTLVLSWKDKRPVTMLSTKSTGSKEETTNVPSKWPNLPPTPKPNVVLDYTKHMGAVDRSDHFVSSYQFMRKTKKWYRKMFFWLLEVSIINSYLLYKDTQTKYNKKPMTHKQFRCSLVVDLVAEKVAARDSSKRRGRQPQRPVQQRLHGRHFMGKKPKGDKCVVCKKNGLRKETVYYCKTCETTPRLHPDDCFEIFHTVADF